MRRRRRRLAWVLFIGWTVLTCAAFLVPVGARRPLVGPGFDKVAHTAVFTGLGALAQTALPWASLLVTLPLAAGLEYAQRFVPRRTFDRVELYANLIGAGFGALLAEAAWRLRK